MNKFWRYLAIGFLLFQGILLAISSACNEDQTTRVVTMILGIALIMLATGLIGIIVFNERLLRELEKNHAVTSSHEPESKNLRKYFLLEVDLNSKEMDVLNAMSDLGGVSLKDLFNISIAHLKGLTKEIVNGAEITAYNPHRGTSKQIISEYFDNVLRRSQDPSHLESTSQFKLVAISTDNVRLDEAEDNGHLVS